MLTSCFSPAVSVTPCGSSCKMPPQYSSGSVAPCHTYHSTPSRAVQPRSVPSPSAFSVLRRIRGASIGK